MSARVFYGWRVVAATFTMALFSFGLGFYGITVYVAMLPPRALRCPRRLAVGINQFTFAFGPSLVGVVRDRADGCGLALTACAALQAVAAVMVLLGPGRAQE